MLPSLEEERKSRVHDGGSIASTALAGEQYAPALLGGKEGQTGVGIVPISPSCLCVLWSGVIRFRAVSTVPPKILESVQNLDCSTFHSCSKHDPPCAETCGKVLGKVSDK